MKIYIIIAAYNEASVIQTVIQEIQKLPYHLVIVDDGSDDDTGRIAAESGAIVLRHSINRGQGAALQTGITYALQHHADGIITFDADGQHCVEDIRELILPIQEGYVDVVLGSRFFQTGHISMPVHKFLLRKLAIFHQWFFTGLRVTDNHCGLRALSGNAARKIMITQDRMSHASEILDQIARHKLRYLEVGITAKDTAYSLKKGQRSVKGSARILYDFFIGRMIR